MELCLYLSVFFLSKLLGSNYIEKYYTEDGKEVITKPENNVSSSHFHFYYKHLFFNSVNLFECSVYYWICEKWDIIFFYNIYLRLITVTTMDV